MREEWDRREERGPRQGRGSRQGRGGRLKVFLGLVTVVFVMTLALVVGNRLSDEALGVLAGAVCGVGAAIPTSLIVVAVTRRHDEAQSRQSETRSPDDWSRPNPYPPVVVVAPPAGHQRSHDSWNALPSSLSAPMERNFTVVGGTSSDRKGGRYGDERRS